MQYFQTIFTLIFGHAKPQLAELYQGSDVFAIASTCETQGLVMMQAFACGLPAVGVRVRALGEYITEKNGILVEGGDYEAMAEKLLFLLQNPGRASELGQGAYNFVQQFSVEKVLQTWEDLYANVLKK